MRTFIHFILMMGVSMVFSQCNSDDTLQEEDVLVSVIDETLEITNRSGTSISYFAVESDFAARIDWAPVSGEDNTIGSKDVKTIPWSEIASENPVQAGDRIIIYWWPTQTSIADSNSVNHLVVVL